MKFIIETHPEDYKCMVLHFDVPVEGLLPRLCEFHDKEEIHDKNPMVVVKYKLALPKASLAGVERLNQVSRYALVVQVGQAFLAADAINQIIKHLEIVPDEEEWMRWMADLTIERIQANIAKASEKLQKKFQDKSNKSKSTEKSTHENRMSERTEKSSSKPRGKASTPRRRTTKVPNSRLSGL